MVTREFVTSEAFDAFIARPENESRRFELIDGEIIEKAMPNDEHGSVASTITALFFIYLREHPELRGRTTVEGRYRPTDNQLNQRLPDVTVILGGRPLVRSSAANFVPDICVEIKSPSERLKDLRKKAAFYLAHGAHALRWWCCPPSG
ncbi:MAG: Uma2 family endonuclease [Chloroflexota bacterium]|nr:Uma2 family endonuclease [Chloroflexota bacterium]